MNAVDTNVYVYALDADEAVKQAKALELFDRLTLHRAETVLIWHALGQYVIGRLQGSGGDHAFFGGHGFGN